MHFRCFRHDQSSARPRQVLRTSCWHRLVVSSCGVGSTWSGFRTLSQDWPQAVPLKLARLDDGSLEMMSSPLACLSGQAACAFERHQPCAITTCLSCMLMSAPQAWPYKHAGQHWALTVAEGREAASGWLRPGHCHVHPAPAPAPRRQRTGHSVLAASDPLQPQLHCHTALCQARLLMSEIMPSSAHNGQICFARSPCICPPAAQQCFEASRAGHEDASTSHKATHGAQTMGQELCLIWHWR